MARGGPLSVFFLALLYGAAVAGVLARSATVDYPVYGMAAWGFARGEEVYHWTEADYARAAAALGFPNYVIPYRYPPLTALLVLPLLALPDRGRGVWIALQALCALLSAEALARAFRDPDRPGTRAWIRLGVGLFPPFLVSLYAGQVNPLATLLIALALAAIRRRGEGWGGFLLGLSLALKPLGLAAAGLLLWEGRWRAAGGALAGLGLGVGAGLLAFGPPALGFLHVPLPTAGGAYPPAQNLPSLAVRWLTRHPYGFALADDAQLARWVGALLAGGLGALTLKGLGRPGRPRGDFPVRAAWVLAAAFLANPGTWYHHGTILGPALAALIGRAPGRPRRWQRALAAAGGAVALWGVAWHAFVGWTPLLDLGTLGALGLWILLAGEIGCGKGATGSRCSPCGPGCS